MRVRVLCVAAVLSTLCMASEAVAQRAEDKAQAGDSVPRELALALLREPGGGVRLLVGTTPERFPFELTPLDSKVLGTLQRERTTTVVFVSKAPVRKALTDWERQLESAGWTRPAGETPVPTNGFMSSDAPELFPVLCSNGRFASLDGTTRFDGGSTLVVQYSHPDAQSLCTVSRHAGASDAQVVITADTMPLPALHPPASVRVVALPVGGAVDDWNQTATLSGSMSAKDVLAHYADQLRRAGYTGSEPANLDATATQTFRRTMPGTGFELFASIVVIANPFDTTSMEARLTVFRRR